MQRNSWISATLVAVRTGTIVPRAFWMCALCSLAMTVSASTAHADAPQPIYIDIHDYSSPDNTAAGTFDSVGAITSSGLESQSYRIAGWSLHCVHTLTDAAGTIIIHSQCNMITNVGQWRIEGGTGAYAGLKGNGSLLMVFNPDDPNDAHELMLGWVY